MRSRAWEMIILGVDTSGKNGSIALAHVPAGQGELEILEVVGLAGGTFSAQLVPQIAGLLVKHAYKKSDIAGFAVVSGPGSFTGLRVGLAAIQALAEVLRQPIAAVSLLEAVARGGNRGGRVLAALDAGRREVYAGDYDLGPPVRMRSERLLSREEFLASARGVPATSPDSDLVNAARAAGVSVGKIDYPRSDVIARLGWERMQRGETVAPEQLDANYIRRSDAEIFSQPKS